MARQQKIDNTLINHCRKRVFTFQQRIQKAYEDKDLRQVNHLIGMLMQSYEATLLAVISVHRNTGGKTPGVDGVVWKSERELLEAAFRLKKIKGYQAQQLRRIYFDKSTGRKVSGKLDEAVKVRPLSIPVMDDRVMQMKAKYALEPITEQIADPASFGFRPKRSTFQAIEYCTNILEQNPDLEFVLEGDIKACFDEISHDFILENFPVQSMLPMIRQWLKCGFLSDGLEYTTERGTPQGGIISPLLANLVLDGMEDLTRQDGIKQNFARYADDFVAFCPSNMLCSELIDMINVFLKKRGLLLSPEKTKITSVNEGFDFLGVNLRRNGSKIERKPSKKSVEKLQTKILLIFAEAHPTNRSFITIQNVLKTLKGWCQYHRDWLDEEQFKKLCQDLNLESLRDAWEERRSQ